jgi:sialate O-acetylesterase
MIPLLKRLAKTLALMAASLACIGGMAEAKVRLPHIFSDHMVLQSGQDITVWGWADPGERVTVKVAGQTKKTRGDLTDGHWSVVLKPLKTMDEPLEMTIKGADETTTIADVLIGEVWLASGQSNMEKPMRNQPGQKDVFNAEDELKAAGYPQLRLFKVKRARANAPAADVEGVWVVCDPTTLDQSRFSAAGYFFGRSLTTALNVPVGLIDSTWGGTRIELWTPPVGFDSVASLSAFSEGAKTPGTKVDGTDLSTLYYGQIAPLVPYAIKGAIWYQGESNIFDIENSTLYADKMTALVTGWRKAWGYDLSFYYTQVAPHLYHVYRSNVVVSPEATPALWEAQTASMRLPKVGMIVTTDLVDDLFDIHPRNKKDIGERLARWALNKDYGKSDVIVSGPTYKGMTVDGGKASLSFDNLGGGLVARDNKALNWFIIAGTDGKFYPAKATIIGDQVVVESPKVAAPVTVRFAWDEAAQPNLMNKAGLPAVPFRTDNPFNAPAP